MGTIGTLPGERLAGLSADLFHKLQKGVRTLDELALFNQGKNPFEVKTEVAPTKLLELVNTVEVPGVERFVAKDYFKKDTSKKAKVKIAFLWDNFTTHFHPKVEENVSAGELKIHKLLKSSVDAAIINELGEAHETYLADLRTLLERQPHGEKGSLLTNGYANVFYIKDKDGATWAVSASWYSDRDGWSLRALPVSYPSVWSGGGGVVSR